MTQEVQPSICPSDKCHASNRMPPLWAACKYLKIMHAANASCCMTLLLLAANAAGCMPHTPNLFFMKPTKQLQASDASAVGNGDNAQFDFEFDDRC